LLQNPDTFRERITRLRGQLIYNLGNSVSEAAGEIARLADERAVLRSAGSFDHD
jgi:hypothetical protein